MGSYDDLVPGTNSYSDLIPGTKKEKPENLLQRAARVSGDIMTEGIDIPFGPGFQAGNAIKNEAFGINKIENPIARFSANYFTDPRTYAGAMAGASTVGKTPSIGSMGKGASKGYEIFMKGSTPVKKRIGEVVRMGSGEESSIASSAKREAGILKDQQSYQRGNIITRGSEMERQAESQAASMAMDEAGTQEASLLGLGKKKAALEGRRASESNVLSSAAKQESLDMEPRASKYFREMSEGWREDVDKISKSHGGIEVDGESVADDLQNMLVKKRNLALESEEGVASGGTTPVENSILKVANLIRKKGALSLDEALQEISKLGKKMKRGASYSSDDHLLDSAKDAILSKIEAFDEVKGLRQRWAQFSNQRTAAIKKFGLYSKTGKYDPTGRKFLEKRALGDIIPEEQQLVSDLESKVGKIGKTSSKIGSRIKDIDSEISRIDEEVKAFSQKNPLKASSKSKEFLDSKKAEIKSTIEREIDELNTAIEKETASIENKSLRDIEASKQKTNKSVERLNDLKRKVDKRQKQLRKTLAISTIGGFVAFRRQLKGLGIQALEAVAR